MKIFMDKYSEVLIGYSQINGGELILDIPDYEIDSLLEAIEMAVAPKDRPQLRDTPLGELNETIRLLNGND